MKNKKLIVNFDEKSQDLKEVLSKAPIWMIRWGMSIVFIILIIIIIGSSIIKYNDIISGKIIITSQNPPVNLEVKSSGRIDSVFVNANEHVEKDRILAIIESKANFKDVEFVKNQINDFKPNINDFLSLDTIFPYDVELGEIQESYYSFRLNYQRYLEYFNYRLEESKHANLKLQIEKRKASLLNKKNQIILSKESLTNIELTTNRQEKLFSKGVISELEFLEFKNKLASVKGKYESLKSSVRMEENSILIAENNLNQIFINDKSSSSSVWIKLQESIRHLKNQIIYWDHNFLIKSPIEGKIAFFDVWYKFQNVQKGDILFTIMPLKVEKLIGRMIIPITNSGKVSVGQDVIIKLDNYPYQEWGSLKGRVNTISSVPKKDINMFVYNVYIEIKDLNSSFDKELEFKQEMQGVADIILEELTVSERILYKLREIFTRNNE